MRKFLFAVVISLICAIYSPSLIQALITTRIRVNDSVTSLGIPGASVTLSRFLNNTVGNLLFSELTNMNGEVTID